MAIQQNISYVLISELESNIQADADDIEIIFNNLISNAVKYNKENGTVIISLTQNANEYKISVKDTGIGMEQEDVDKLFHEFTRIRNEKTKHISGSGLGLSILEKMVRKYNGKVEVNSVWGEGSEFVVSIN